MSAQAPRYVCVFFLAVLCWTAALPAQEARSGLLFEVRNAAADSCWLFGTIHSEDPRVLDLPRPVAEAFEAAESFVLEVIPDTQAIIHSMLTMVYTDGRTLESVVGPDLYRDAVAAAGSLGMSEVAIRDFKPWALVTLLSVPSGSSGEFLDLRLYRLAVAAGKPVTGVETMDEQLAVFEGLSEADQITLLRETLEVQEQLPAVFERLLQAYLERDLDGLQRLSEEYLHGGDRELAERFRVAAIEVRNARMAERLVPIIEQGDCFIAVGALHLPGPDGLLARLQRHGFAVRTEH